MDGVEKSAPPGRGGRAVLPDIAGIFCLAVFIGLFLVCGERMLGDGDTLWHIKAGAVMIENQTLLKADVFSHSAIGKPWTAHEWLAEIVMAALEQTAGLAGVAVFFALLAALTFWLLFVIARRYAGDWVSIVTVAIAFGLAYTHLMARPHLFSWLLGVITLYLLLRKGKSLFILPLLTVLWVNLHGGFVLGLVLQGLFLAACFLEKWAGSDIEGWKKVFREEKIPLAALFFSVLAVGVNPFGYTLLLFPFKVAAPIFARGIAEWHPPNMSDLWYFRLYLLSILFLLAAGRYRTSWNDRLFILFFVNASLVHQRNISVAGIFLTPYLARALGEEGRRFQFRRKKGKGERALKLSPHTGPALTVLLALLLLTLGMTGSPSWERLSGKFFPLPKEYSPEAIAFLKENTPAGNVFNDYSWGDYLIYETDIKVFIDGRADMYGEELFGDYQKIARLDEEAEELLTKHDISWVIFAADHPLTRYLKITGRWDEAYEDDKVAILVLDRGRSSDGGRSFMPR